MRELHYSFAGFLEGVILGARVALLDTDDQPSSAPVYPMVTNEFLMMVNDGNWLAIIFRTLLVMFNDGS